MQRMINQTAWIFGIVVAVWLLYRLSPILTPFLVAGILAYLADPLVRLLKRWHLPNLLSVILVFVVVYSVVIFLVLLLTPLIQKQINLLIVTIPSILTWVQERLIPWLSDTLGMDDLTSSDTLKNTLGLASERVGGVVSWIFKTTLHSGMTLVQWLVNLALIPVVTFYLLRDWDKFKRGVRNLLPRGVEPTVIKLSRECDQVLSSFFRGQLIVMLCLGTIYSIGLNFIGLKLGVLIGLVAGLASIVPYLGLIIGITTASIVALVQFGTWQVLIKVGIVFLIGQCIESMLLTPLLIGHRIGLHPVAVIFAVLTGGTLFGFFGILLALPVAAIIMVWLRFLNQRYRSSHFYQKSKE